MARPLTVAGIFAHPDDETWSLAGSFALLVPKGVRGAVWTATRARPARSPRLRRHPRDPARGPGGRGAGGHGRGRGRAGRVRRLRRRRGQGADLDALTAGVHRFLEREQPDVVVTMEPGGVTTHPDHVAVTAATQAAFGAYVAAAGGAPRFYYWGVPVSGMAGWRQLGRASGYDLPGGRPLRRPRHPRRPVHLHGRHLSGGRAGLAGPVPAPDPGRRPWYQLLGHQDNWRAVFARSQFIRVHPAPGPATRPRPRWWRRSPMGEPAPKVAFKTLGCRLNQAESEQALEALGARGSTWLTPARPRTWSWSTPAP